RVVVHRGHCVPPPGARDVDVGDVHLPQIVRLLRQELEQPRRLVHLSHACSGPLQEPVITHHHIRFAILHRVARTTTHHRDALVAVPGVVRRHLHHRLNDRLRNRFPLRPRTLSWLLVVRRTIPTARRDTDQSQHLRATRPRWSLHHGHLLVNRTTRFRG